MSDGGSDEEQTTLGAAKFDPTPAPSASFVLRIEGSTAPPFVIDGSSPSRLLLGCSAACATHLDDRLVSRRHLALDLVGTRLKITDLGSTNGTYVNDLAVGEAFLQGGERIRVGASALSVERHPVRPLAPLPTT